MSGLPRIGTEVKLCGSHPWSGHRGTVVCRSSWIGRPSVEVQLQNGCKAGVTRPEHWMYVPPAEDPPVSRLKP